MAYIDLGMRPPAEDDPARAEAMPTPRRPLLRRAGTPRGAMWIGVGLAGILIALIFALAFASIGEPFVAAIVTLVLLLPAASLFGGDAPRQR